MTVGEVFLSTKNKPSILGRIMEGRFTFGMKREPFTRLTPRLLSLIRTDVLPAVLRDNIKLATGVPRDWPDQNLFPKAHVQVVEQGLSSLRGGTKIVVIKADPDFWLLTSQLKSFDDLAMIMRQANDKRLSGGIDLTCKYLSGNVRFKVTREVAANRGVTAWLERHYHLESADERQELGLALMIDRFYSSEKDRVFVWVPLDIEAIGEPCWVEARRGA